MYERRYVSHDPATAEPRILLYTKKLDAIKAKIKKKNEEEEQENTNL